MKSSAMCLAPPATNINCGLLTKQEKLCPSLPGDTKEPEASNHSGCESGAQIWVCPHLDGDLYLAIFCLTDALIPLECPCADPSTSEQVQ